jgi:hypothetical protein
MGDRRGNGDAIYDIAVPIVDDDLNVPFLPGPLPVFLLIRGYVLFF